MVSLDVVSMFDSIPIDLAMECVEEKLSLFHNLTKISKKEILIAIRTIFNNTVFWEYCRIFTLHDVYLVVCSRSTKYGFSLNKNYYKQVSGCFEKIEF